MPDVVRIGDRLRISVELVDAMKADPQTGLMLVRVQSIIREGDGSVTLWLENVPQQEGVA